MYHPFRVRLTPSSCPDAFSGFFKNGNTEPLALNLSVKAGVSEELCFTSEFCKWWCMPLAGPKSVQVSLPMGKPVKILASHPVHYKDTSLFHTELQCCCLRAGQVGWPGDTALPASPCPSRRPTAGAAQAEHRALCKAVLEDPCLTATKQYKLFAYGTAGVCDLCFTSKVTVNVHSGLKKCWSLCQERKVKTEATERRPKVGGSS